MTLPWTILLAVHVTGFTCLSLDSGHQQPRKPTQWHASLELPCMTMRRFRNLGGFAKPKQEDQRERLSPCQSGV